MSKKDPKNSSGNNRLVVALDYGTTYTGVAFGDESLKYVRDIQIITDWPGFRRNASDEKVPSQVAYGNFGSGPDNYDWGTWGNLIPPGVKSFAWTKLLLDQERITEELNAASTNNSIDTSVLDPDQSTRTRLNSDGPPAYPAKSPVEIVTDFLTAIKNYTFKFLEINMGRELLKNLRIDMVITFPAVWSERARDLTLQAATRAGFGDPNDGQRLRIKMVTEPEAAATYTLRALRETTGSSDMKANDHFILCDAGGGTVDLLSYRIRSLYPDFRIEEAAVGTGDKCGSTFIDRAFRDWFKRKIGNVAFNKIPKAKLEEGSKLRNEFEMIKSRFTGTPIHQYVTVPREAGLEDHPEVGIVDGELKIEVKDMEEMFNFSVTRTIELIDHQAKEIQAKGRRIKSVFLVGGFGKSNYLFSKIREYCEEKGFEAIRPSNPWSAVVRGAVARGLEPDDKSLICLRLCRLHYGTIISLPYQVGIHNVEDMYIDGMTGKLRANGQIDWMIPKGTPLPTDDPKSISLNLSCSYKETQERVTQIKLVSAISDDAPAAYRDSGVLDVCKFKADLSGIPISKFEKVIGYQGDLYYVANITVHVEVDNTRLKYYMTCSGEVCGTVEANFDG